MSNARSPRAVCSTTMGTRALPNTSTGSRSLIVFTFRLRSVKKLWRHKYVRLRRSPATWPIGRSPLIKSILGGGFSFPTGSGIPLGSTPLGNFPLGGITRGGYRGGAALGLRVPGELFRADNLIAHRCQFQHEIDNLLLQDGPAQAIPPAGICGKPPSSGLPAPDSATPRSASPPSSRPGSRSGC